MFAYGVNRVKKRRPRMWKSITGRPLKTMSLEQFKTQGVVDKSKLSTTNSTRNSAEGTMFRPPAEVANLFEREVEDDVVFVGSSRKAEENTTSNSAFDMAETTTPRTPPMYQSSLSQMQPFNGQDQIPTETCRAHGPAQSNVTSSTAAPPTFPAQPQFARSQAPNGPATWHSPLTHSPSCETYSRAPRQMKPFHHTREDDKRLLRELKMLQERQEREDIRHTKQYQSSVEAVQRLKSAITEYLSKNPGHQRTKTELAECLMFENVVNSGKPLDPVAKDRTRRILKNVERRNYTLEVELVSKRIGLSGKTEYRNDIQSMDTDNLQGNSIFDPRVEPSDTETSQLAGNATTNQKLAETAAIPSDVEMSRADAEDLNSSEIEASNDEGELETNEMEGCLEDQYFWEYAVYRTEYDEAHDSDGPQYLGTFLDRNRAEALLRSEIDAASPSLEDRQRMEIRTMLEENLIQAQVVEFASGRSVEIHISKGMVEAGKLDKKQKAEKKKKLARLPTTLYSIMETIVDLQNISDPVFSVWKESFVLREHANKQASKRLIERMIAHLKEDETFDVSMTGNIDAEARLYLRELENGERLFDKQVMLPAVKEGEQKQLSIRVVEQLVRGPRN